MKKIVLICLILFNNSFVFAQKADTNTNKLIVTKVAGGAAMSSSKNLIENLSASNEFSILVKAIKADSLTHLFDGNFPITVFAPTNKAFEKLSAGKLDTLLLPVHKKELENLVMYHCVAGIISSKDIAKQIKAGNGQATLTTLSGGVLTARINENRNIVLTDENGGQSVISQFDIKQNDGILHMVTAVLIPKSK
jgi:uncharacterized surface protein with fasciclin (FAS1) repeats